jgi:hypothetical protein
MLFRRLLPYLVSLAAALPAPGAETPRLAVVITVDQMRADFLVRFRPHFGAGGFQRWLEAGANYHNCHYHYAVTKTAPGHASILSGVGPDVHGIIANEWLDRTTFLQGNAVEDANAPLVGLPPRPGRYLHPGAAAKAGRSPRNFLATTVGDWLKTRYGASAKVVGVADKDRSAILPVGRHPDGAYWTEEGVFVTSTWYRSELPAWVQAFNARRNAAQYFGQTWDRLLAPEYYDRLQGPDDAAGEEKTAGLPSTFPKRVGRSGNPQGGSFNSAFERTPWANELIAEMALQAIESEQMGRDDVPDLLAIGFSQPDSAGHAYGPDSHEVMDTYLRLDRTLAELFAALDARVGAGRWVAVLTADHGIPPLPERVQAERGAGAAGRIEGGSLDRQVRAALDEAFGPLPDPLYWVLRDNSGYHFNPRALAHKSVSPERAAAVVQAALRSHPGIAAAYTRAQLTAATPLDELGEMSRRSYRPERSPDVVFVEQPFFQIRAQGTTHGTPHDYDTHVPLAWYGAGVKPGVHPERVGVQDLAPTLAGLLGVEPAPEVRGKRLF